MEQQVYYCFGVQVKHLSQAMFFKKKKKKKKHSFKGGNPNSNTQLKIYWRTYISSKQIHIWNMWRTP